MVSSRPEVFFRTISTLTSEPALTGFCGPVMTIENAVSAPGTAGSPIGKNIHIRIQRKADASIAPPRVSVNGMWLEPHDPQIAELLRDEARRQATGLERRGPSLAHAQV